MRDSSGVGSGAALLPQGRKLYLQYEFGNSSPRHGITGRLASGRTIPLPPRLPPRTCHRLRRANAMNVLACSPGGGRGVMGRSQNRLIHQKRRCDKNSNTMNMRAVLGTTRSKWGPSPAYNPRSPSCRAMLAPQ